MVSLPRFPPCRPAHLPLALPPGSTAWLYCLARSFKSTDTHRALPSENATSSILPSPERDTLVMFTLGSAGMGHRGGLAARITASSGRLVEATIAWTTSEWDHRRRTVQREARITNRPSGDTSSATVVDGVGWCIMGGTSPPAPLPVVAEEPRRCSLFVSPLSPLPPPPPPPVEAAVSSGKCSRATSSPHMSKTASCPSTHRTTISPFGTTATAATALDSFTQAPGICPLASIPFLPSPPPPRLSHPLVLPPRRPMRHVPGCRRPDTP